MAHGQHISPINGNKTSPVNKGETPNPGGANDFAAPPVSPKENSGALFTRRWQNGQADDLRNLLTSILADADPNFSPENNPFPPADSEQTANLLDQNWEDLIGVAQNHPDFENFQNQPAEFWENVRQISELRVVETYVNGELASRVESDYGKMLGQFEQRGGNLHDFVASLPADKGKVFEARYQINQTFGADELFAGKGIALDKNGQLPLGAFLKSHGESLNLPPHSVLSLTSEIFADAAFLKNNPTFANAQILLTAKSAALFGLSLALYQNVNARIPLGDAAVETAPQAIINEQVSARAAASQNASEKSKTNELQPKNNLLAAAFVSGALTTINEYAEFGNRKTGAWTGAESSLTLQNFSVGAVGAIMGATIGCIVPLAKKNAGEATGFAAGIVVGLANAEIRRFGAQTMLSVIQSGAQKILNASADSPRKLTAAAKNKFLGSPAAGNFSPEKELRKQLFNRRLKTLLIS